MRLIAAVLLVCGASSSLLAQAGYTIELRLIADGDAGSPGGPSPALTFPVQALQDGTATRVGFWLQARVAQTVSQNWGVARASPLSGTPSTPSTITVTDPLNLSSLTRGAVNAAGTAYGRGAGYRNGGPATGETGNAPGAGAFPSSVLNENGALDNPAGGPLMTRIYGFDSYAGSFRDDIDGDSDGDGFAENPWRVNGGTGDPAVAGTPWPSDGTFAPWANLYRFCIDIGSTESGRVLELQARALVNGTYQAAPLEPAGNTFALGVRVPGPVLTATYSLAIPTPAGATLVTAASLMSIGRRSRGRA